MGKIKALKQSKAIQIIEWHGIKQLVIKVWKFLITISINVKYIKGLP